MSTGGPAPVPYSVSYSARVLDALVRLGQAARGRGDGERFVATLREFHRRLAIYPQFGDPLTDLGVQPGHVRLGVVPPLVMRYAVFEERRLVHVGALPVLLRRAGPAAGCPPGRR